MVSVNFIITAILLANADFIANLYYSWPQRALKVFAIFFLVKYWVHVEMVMDSFLYNMVKEQVFV